MRDIKAAVFIMACLFHIAPVEQARAQEGALDLELSTTYERWTLPGNEKMGMANVRLSEFSGEYFNYGIESYTAVAGERGGFITIGAHAGLRFPVSQRLSLDSGLSVGAGGGRGGYFLSGGGLMLRGHAGLKYAAPIGQLGLGVSYVSFPENGDIDSAQAYISYSLPFSVAGRPGLNFGTAAQAGNAIPRRKDSKTHQFSLVTRSVMANRQVLKDASATVFQEDFKMLGVRWRTHLTDTWIAQFETVGGGGGNSAGYMHLLAGLGARQSITRNLSVYETLSIGGGGGGGVPTGGGFLVDAAIGVQYLFPNSAFIDVSASKFLAPSTAFSNTTLNLNFGYQLGTARPADTGSVDRRLAYPVRIRTVQQNYKGTHPNWRNRPAQPVDNLGFQIDYFMSPNMFLTGQAIGAWGGDAGAYMTGLVGAGVHKDLIGNLFVEAEGLVGVAGGGGLTVGSGAVGQVNLGLGYQFTPRLSAMVSTGKIKSFDGDFEADVLGVSLNYDFTLFF
ncbi:MAG: hypothetical protein WBC93_16775 [Sulfitobacter sp.]